jgi:hypothetical protein
MARIGSILLCAFFLSESFFHSGALCGQKEDEPRPLNFVLHLIDKNEYDLALLEIERFIHTHPLSPVIPKARLLSGFCHMEAGRLEKAIKILEELAATCPDAGISHRALFLTAECLFRQGKLKEAQYYFESLSTGEAEPQIKTAALYRLGWTKMKGDDWKEASRIFLSMEGEDGLSSDARLMAHELLKADRLPLKDPELAGVLAGALPGMGHLYVGRYRDAATAFVLNAVFILAAVEAFREDQEVLGGILGFLEIGWYAGNIYSAVNAAHKHNRRIRDDFRGRFMDRLMLKPLLSRDGLTGIGFSFLY